ncbi:MAG: MBOAT family protein [Clostridiales bacterium]|nr:MBOAT family protein [Clostridiales bacterium]MBR4010279.1 MBOAT family protein [Clostridiales bacterium]
MTITSLSFFLFLIGAVTVYYIAPSKFQWVRLLLLSLIFYGLAAKPVTFLYVLISTGMAWCVTNGMESGRKKKDGAKNLQTWKFIMVLTIVIDVFLWFFLKGREFITSSLWGLNQLFPSIRVIELPPVAVAMGMGYYTLQIISYTIDCYWENAKPQRNFLKLLLFCSFFPQMITGPISRYDQLSSLYEEHRIKYVNLAHGTQRILWGMFKKIVVAERCGIIVNAVWADFTLYGGIYTWIALLLYPLQLYSDFSGCCDIVIGVAELFDIKLVENFKNPFFSQTSQEFWQRWHITLGTWAKDYVLYPVLKSTRLQKLNKKLKNRFGKKAAKFITTAIGMAVLWLVLGIWHGAFRHIIGVSLWYWIILMLEDFLKPRTEKLNAKFGFKTDSFGWKFFRAVRTYLTYSLGIVFFRAKDVAQGFSFLREVGRTFTPSRWNPWILFDDSILKLGISYKDINVIVISVLALIAVAAFREKHGYARNWIDTQPVLFRRTLYVALLLAVVLLGAYGPGYSASAFIYGQF